LIDRYIIFVCLLQPKQIKNLKEFLATAKRKDASSVKIKRNGKGKTTVTKFKLRCSKYLYSYTVNDKDKAEKLASSLPSNLKREDIK